MSTENQDLQATHKILNVIEKSKNYSDSVIDNFMGIFATVTQEGTVYRGNKLFSHLLSIDVEDLLGLSVFSIFQESTKQIFKHKMDELIEKKLKDISFELPVDGIFADTSLIFYWTISAFNIGDKSQGLNLYTIIGTDITKLRESEKQLSEIFSSIPVGILSFNSNGNIEPKYSDYAEVIFEARDLKGRNFEELIFKAGYTALTRAEKEGVENLKKILGGEVIIYEMLKETFPKQVYYPLTYGGEVKEKWLGIKYQAIVQNEKIKKILLMVEDRTSIVLSEKEQEANKLLQDKTIARIVQIKKCDPEILKIITEELEQLLTSAKENLGKKDKKELQKNLHAIKGNCRIAGFSRLVESSHNLESELKVDNNLNWDKVGNQLTEIAQEWFEIRVLYSALSSQLADAVAENGVVEAAPESAGSKVVKDMFAQYNSLLSTGKTNEAAILNEKINMVILASDLVQLNSIQVKVDKCVQATCDTNRKDVEVTYDWKNVLVTSGLRNKISECLIHLVSNAIDHGVELPEVREAAGKERKGTIKISAKQLQGFIELTVEDNGGGINIQKVRKKSIKSGLLTLDESLSLSEQQIIQYIFQDGVSTAETVSVVSGRGVGLSAVKNIVEENKGTIEVFSQEVKGTKFVIKIADSHESLEIIKNCNFLSDFEQKFKLFIDTINQTENLKIKVNFSESLSKGDVIYADLSKLNLALTSLIVSNCADQENEVVVEVKSDKELLVLEARKSVNSSKLEKIEQYKSTLPVCENYLFKHSGSIVDHAEKLIVKFGYVLSKVDLPSIVIGSDSMKLSNTEVDDVKKLVIRIQELLSPMGIKHSFSFKSQAGVNLFITSGVANDNRATVNVKAEGDQLKNQFLNALKIILNEK